MPFSLELNELFSLTKPSFVAVFLSSSSLGLSLELEQLITLFGLTRREGQLAVQLCKGFSTDDIASRDGVQTSTLRKQLKSIYAKTGTHRQGELIAMLLNSLASYRV